IAWAALLASGDAVICPSLLLLSVQPANSPATPTADARSTLLTTFQRVRIKITLLSQLGRDLTPGTMGPSGPRRPPVGGPQLVMTSNFVGGEGAIVERQLVDQPDKGTAMHAS